MAWMDKKVYFQIYYTAWKLEIPRFPGRLCNICNNHGLYITSSNNLFCLILNFLLCHSVNNCYI